MTGGLADELAFASRLADLADAVTLPRYRAADFTLGWKDDRSEVTEVDRATESLLAAEVAAERGSHGFFGEEHGLQGNVDSPWRWIVDPIDGTSGFVRGIPVWATLVALVHADRGPVVGLASAPALGRRWWAADGLGAFADGRPCTVSDVADPTLAQVSVTFSEAWERLGLTHELTGIAQRARRARGFGDFWQHCLVAEGAIDLAVDAVEVALYDVAALRVIVAEAGGTITDRHGRAPEGGAGAISSNGLLHADVIARLGSG